MLFRSWGWQLVPDIHSMRPPLTIHEHYDCREHGYWHIARTQVMRAAEITQKLGARVQSCYCDDSRFMRGGLLEVTFEPAFVRYKTLLPRVTIQEPLSLPHIPRFAALPQPPSSQAPQPPDPKKKQKRPRFLRDDV